MIPPFFNLKSVRYCVSFGITGMAITANGLLNGKIQVNPEENNHNTNSFKASMMKILTEKQEMPKQKKSMEVVVVGGGVSGLSTAWT